LRGTISSTREYLKKRPVKGEITLLIGLSSSPDAAEGAAHPASIRSEIDKVMAERGLDEKGALKVVARARGVPRSEAYRQLQMEKNRKP
jgi:16S rRNA (cytidine1402-2'-O)-methyltransferase